MNSCKQSAIWVCLAVALSASPIWAQPDGGDPEVRAARRAEARNVVVQDLQERAVRAVDSAVVARDAARIVKRLSDEQVEALLAGEEASTLRVRTADGELRSAVQPALGEAESDLLFVPVEPCRIIDTRLPGAGGMITPGPSGVRQYEVAGTTGFENQGGKAGGCGIPLGASTPLAAAVVINFVAVGPQGPGHLRAWEFNQAPPNASIINYTNVSGLNIANGVIVPIAGVASLDKDLSIDANTSPTFIVADVTGYFTRFPSEQFQGGLKSTATITQNTTLTSMADGACKELNTCTVTTDSAGTVIVEAWGQFVADHTAGTLDRVAIGIETAATVACNDDDSVDASDFEVPASLGSNSDVDFTVSHGRAFTQNAGQTRTYRLSGRMISGANSGDEIENSRMICTFIPD
ncbi:MAG TPA: hypothetical protein VN493_06095 [Thermoanaerobaculia bacterium]|nr:hypothetical protein [Thermoanaerobaculia bacterium]